MIWQACLLLVLPVKPDGSGVQRLHALAEELRALAALAESAH